MTSITLDDGKNDCSVYFTEDKEKSYEAAATHSHWVNYTSGREHQSENFAEYTEGNKVDFFLGGKAYFAELLTAFKQAQKSIYITGWQVNWDAQLAEGVRLVDALVDAAKNAPQLKVYIMPWANPSQVETYSKATERVFAAMNTHLGREAFCVLLAGSKSGMMFSHHQKCVIIDEKLAFVGGIDLAYGRYDDRYGLIANADGRQGLNMYNPCLPPVASGKGYNPMEENTFYGAQYDNKGVMEKASVEHIIGTVLKHHYGQSPGPSWQTVYTDPAIQPRMPWQDYQVQIAGPAVDDLVRNFVLRWNSYSHSVRDSALKTDIPELTVPATPSEKKGSCQVQVLRSASLRMRQDEYKHMPQVTTEPGLKQDDILRSIHLLISKAEHYIYIENQFFVSEFGESSIPVDEDELSPVADSLNPSVSAWATRIMPDDDAPQNPVAEWLGDRLKRVIFSNTPQPFHIYIVLPVHPEGKLDDPTIVAQIHLTRQSLVFGSLSLLNRIRRSLWVKQQLEAQGVPRKEWHCRIPELKDECDHQYENIELSECDTYITLLNLRDHAQISGMAVTEQIYVHSKLMIVDDRYVLVGSANINDRSLMGDRDSELAVLISDTAHGYTDLDGTGKTSPYRNFARELRQSAWRKWLGSAAGECAEALDKPATGWGKIQEVARKNASVYEDVFNFIPKDFVNNNGDSSKKSLSVSAGKMVKEIPASLWSIMKSNAIPDDNEKIMPFAESFWQHYKYQDKGSLKAKVKGYFTALPVRWTEGENNLIPYNMRLIASNTMPEDEDIQIADNQDGNDVDGSSS